jgi:hypothetical protein
MEENVSGHDDRPHGGLLLGRSRNRGASKEMSPTEITITWTSGPSYFLAQK